MTEKTNFFLNIIHTLVSIYPKNRLPNPFSSTGMVSITFLVKYIKYWKINSKNIRLRLKTLIKNDLLLNEFQILA